MTQAPTIREAISTDLAQLVGLLQDDTLGQTRETGFELPAYTQALSAILADPHHSLLVMTQREELIACVQVSYLPNLTFKGAWRAQLEGVRVARQYRGQGLGKRLIREAILRAQKQGCKIVQLTTDSTRKDALAFYESLGFLGSHVGMKLYLEP